MKTEGIDFNEGLYAEAENLMGFNAKALQAMALLAHENRKDKEALRVLSFVWGRSSKAMARAVERWPGDFQFDNPAACQNSPDELLALFLLGTLGAKEAAEMWEQWRKYTLRAWQLRERIEAMREAKRDRRTKPIKFSNALVNLVKKDEMALVNLLGYPDFKQLVSGRYDVTLRPVVEKKAKKSSKGKE